MRKILRKTNETTLTTLKVDKIIGYKLLGHQFVNATLWYAVEISTEYNGHLLFTQVQIGDRAPVNVFHVKHEKSNL